MEQSAYSGSILALDVGSAHIFGGIVQEGNVQKTFSKTTGKDLTEDELGIFLTQWLSIQGLSKENLSSVVVCSVVPELNSTVILCSRNYLGMEPLLLRAGIKSGLKVKYSNPHELGTDLIANAVAAVNLFPKKDMVIVDFGTATSLCAVSAEGEYLGGALFPGLDIAMDALASRTSRLPAVDIQPVRKACGRDAASGIQGGLYYGTLGMLKELIYRIGKENFGEEKPLVIATGSHATLFKNFTIFDHLIPELVLLGLEQIGKLNTA